MSVFPAAALSKFPHIQILIAMSVALFTSACGSATIESEKPAGSITVPTIATAPATPPAPSSFPLLPVGPAPPASAIVFDHVEDRQTWGHCTDCAAKPGDPNPPLALWEFQQYQTSPSLDGSSLRFYIAGSSPYANALHWTKFGAQNQFKTFLFEFDIYASIESLKAQNLEFDVFQSVGGKKYMFGTQCNYIKGIWQGWNEVAIQWFDLPQAPCKKFEPGKWTHVKWLLERTDDSRLHYISVTVGDTSYDVNSYQAAVSSSWGDVLGLQFQQDLNSHPDGYAIWVDQVRLSAW